MSFWKCLHVQDNSSFMGLFWSMDWVPCLPKLCCYSGSCLASLFFSSQCICVCLGSLRKLCKCILQHEKKGEVRARLTEKTCGKWGVWAIHVQVWIKITTRLTIRGNTKTINLIAWMLEHPLTTTAAQLSSFRKNH